MAAWTYDDPRTYWQQDLSPADIQSMMAAWDSQGPGGRALINGYGLSRAMDRAPMSDAQDTANTTFFVAISEGHKAVRTAYFAPSAPYAPPSGFAYWDV